MLSKSSVREPHRVRLKHKSKDDSELGRKPYFKNGRSKSVSPQLQKFNAICHTDFKKPTEVLNGFYAVTVSNDIYFEGLFKDGERYGPGVLTILDSMSQNVGWWQGKEILRLIRLVCSSWVPRLNPPKRLNADYKFSKMGSDSFQSNMKVIMCMYRNFTCRNMAEPHIDFAVPDLERLLNENNHSILVKRCEHRENVMSEDDWNADVIANTGVMSDLFKFTSDYLNVETSYNLHNFILNARSDFAKAGIHEKACIDFLTMCSNGDKTCVENLTANNTININVCDGHGNTGVMFAAARDKINTIMDLAHLKANFDLINDDGVTPLVMVILRFIALLRNIQNWNAAFVDTANLGSEKEKQTPKERAQLVPFSEITFYYEDKVLPALEERLQMRIDQIFTFYGLHLPAPPLQNFSSAYYNSVNYYADADKFVFDVCCKESMRRGTIEKRDVPLSRKVDNDTFLRLTVVFNTFVALLHCGSDPNKGPFPLPPLTLALFTENKDIVKMLLKFGADPLLRNRHYHDTTVLHTLVSMPFGKYLIDMAKVLLEADFDLDVRTSGNHWWEVRHWVLGNIKGVLDCGKTALHILAMRADFRSASKFVKHLAELLIEKGASLSRKYLGHVPLTLAMQRGNVNLVKTFLKCGASANEELGGKMGVPLALYLLHRYKDQMPPFDVCKSIMCLLYVHGADPLQRVGSSCNVVEFLNWELRRSMCQTVNGMSIKRIKAIRYTPTHRRIRAILMRFARRRLLRHYACLMFLALLLNVREAQSARDRAWLQILTSFVNFHDAVLLVRYLMFVNVLDPSNECDFQILRNLFRLLRKRWARSTQRRQQEISSILTSLKPLPPKGCVPELDIDFEKYRVCFSCCLRTRKRLLSCPSCGLVLFCSKNCELYSKRHNLHPCNGTYYRDEYTQYKFCVNHKIHYEGVHDEMFNNIRNILKKIIENES